MNEEILKQIIIDTIKGEEHLGENLKEQCVDYIEQLQNNRNKLTKWVIGQEQKAWDEVSSTFGYVLNKMQELQGDNKN